ncbi:hypothetical protein FRC12_005565 [Ceratobasidium sp. 428]|nr:hypothetical protein FRC12_005565 [Ceratobasidium sp. 428]
MRAHLSQNKKVPISEFCGLTLNLRSRIDSIQCFQEGRQEFVLVLTRGLFLYAHSEQKTWIRLERGLKAAAKSGWAGKWEMIRGKVEAHDTATISLDRKSLIRSHAAPTEILEFERPAIDYGKPVMLKHLLTLLTLMEKVALDYNPLKDNRWVFCQTIVDCMENYQTSRITLRRPNTDLERREAIKAEFIEKIGTQLYNYGPSP